MSDSEVGETVPKSMRHRKILDIAANRPDASVDEIAEEVPSATADLVERVLEDYGDPAADTEDGGEDTGDSSDDTERDSAAIAPSDSTASEAATSEAVTEAVTASNTAQAEEDETDVSAQYPTMAELSEREVETLRAIATRPDATQRELAELLDVSAATVSTRVNNISGFQWADRRAFVEAVLDSVPEPAHGEVPIMSDELADLRKGIETLNDRLAALDSQLEGAEEQADSSLEPELAHKVVHTCMESSTFSKNEELRILKALVE